MKYVKVVTKSDIDQASARLLAYTRKHNISLDRISGQRMDADYIDTQSHVLKELDGQIDTSTTAKLNQSIADFGKYIKFAYLSKYPLLFVGMGVDDLYRPTLEQINSTLKKAKTLVAFDRNPQVQSIKKLLYTGKGSIPSLSRLEYSDHVANGQKTLTEAMDSAEKVMQSYGTSTEDLAEHNGDWSADSPYHIVTTGDWLLSYFGNDPDNARFVRKHLDKYNDKYIVVNGEVHLDRLNAPDVIGSLITLRSYLVGRA